VEPLPLAGHQRVTIIVSDRAALGSERSRLDSDYIEGAKREVAKMTRVPSLEEVHQRMSKIQGSIAQAIAAERDER
jgi:hypothetical protein